MSHGGFGPSLMPASKQEAPLPLFHTDFSEPEAQWGRAEGRMLQRASIACQGGFSLRESRITRFGVALRDALSY